VLAVLFRADGQKERHISGGYKLRYLDVKVFSSLFWCIGLNIRSTNIMEYQQKYVIKYSLFCFWNIRSLNWSP